ncbi:MAG: hypothetical protein ABSF80_12785 [Chitinispirillaceae bacterium]|jgi:hypothetical protein
MEMKKTAFIAGVKRVNFFVVAAAITFVYVPSRLCLMHYGKITADMDTDLYARYAYIHRLARERHVPFHDLYRTMGLADIVVSGPNTFDSLTLTIVAYPPFAVAMMTVPALIVQRGPPISRINLSAFTARYKKVYHWLSAASEMLTVVIVSLLVLVVYKNERAVLSAFRMCIVCMAGMCMQQILYDRLDVILGALLMLSVVLLIRKSMILRLLSFFIFALAVNFKLIPVFLLPVWILGSFQASDFEMPTWRARVLHMVRMCLSGGFLLCGMTAGVTLFFYLIEGKGVFDFLAFHLVRGIHIESTWGAFSLLAARLFCTPFQMTLTYGAYHVVTPATTVLSSLSMATLAACLIAVTVLFVVRFVVGLRQPSYSPLGPQAVIEASLLYLCVVFSFSKVFSPQYLLVLVPLVALLPYTGRGVFVFSCVFIGVCCLSTIIYPYCYTKAIIRGPTWFGLYLLTARMLLLLGMTGFLFVRASGMRDNGSHFGAGNANQAISR